MSLTRDQRARIFAGELPRISGEGACPFQAGDVLNLSSKVSLKVVRVLRRPGGRWTLRYEVHDRRDPVRILRRTPAIHDEGFDAIRKSFDQYGYPPEKVEDEDAARESAYTTAPSSLADAGEAVDEVSQRRFSEQARTKAGQRATLNQLRREHYDTGQRLIAAREHADLTGMDISSPMRVIERQLVKIERMIHEGKAA